MSVFQPSAEPQYYPSPADAPQFRVAMRGFDRQEVAAYLRELSVHLQDQHQRAEQAERTIAQLQLELTAVKGQAPSFEDLGVGAAKVLEQAGHSAELLVDEAENRAKGIVEEARSQAAELVAAAEQHAEQLRSSASEEAQQTLDGAREATERMRRESREERAGIKLETERLRSFHDGLLERLHGLRRELATVLEPPADQPRNPAAPANGMPAGGASSVS
jgi:cell division initiation protein